MEQELPVDIFRRVVGFSTNSRSILDLWSLNDTARCAIEQEIRKLSKNAPIRLDIHRFFLESNPFHREFFGFAEKIHKKQLHDKIRELARLLEKLLEIGAKFQIDNLTAASLGFQAEHDEQHLPRAPFMLQKKMMHILSRFHGNSISISPVFMRPSRMIRTFRNRFDEITTLDLGTMKSLASCQLRSVVFPALQNLENLTWNHANHRILHKIPNKNRIKSLHLTCHLVGRPRFPEFEVLKEFSNLEKFYLGFTVPINPSRMEMEVLLNLYQSIWSRKMGNLLENFPKIREIGFWNSPEKIFQQLSKYEISLETLNFGSLNQSLSMLCSFDSILQSFFKFEELENALEPPKIKHLNMNLHTMPAVGLDYYLPNLMNRVNQFPDLQTVSLLFKCIFHAQMTSSWSMESKKEKSSKRRPIFESTYTKFQLHSEGLCGLTDLDRQLPPTLESCSISLNLPADGGRKVIPSVLKFIEKLGSMNDFPELVEFHIQILGVKCFETLIHAIGDHLGPHLHKVSIYAPLNCTEKSLAKRLMSRIPELFPKATEISISIDFLRILLKESAQSSAQWPEKLTKLARKHEFNVENCKLTTGRLPRCGSQFVCKGDEPRDLTELEEELGISILEETLDGMNVELLDDDDWIVDDDNDEDGECIDEEEDYDNTEIVYESEEDELDGLEAKLERESDRRHKKWEKKNKVMIDSDDEEEEEENDDDKENQDDDTHDIVDWDKLDESDEDEDELKDRKHGLFDDEASESDGEDEFEDEDEEEPEGEDLEDSDDERLFEHGPSKKRRFEQQKQNAKRRCIVISDDDDDDEE
ncbi:F-box domain-containing protein [Caenorhabditis elegans]|uniref:F-box domain-containing protein n=2 Tax=Caenorhabditis elegans TaxID=6239 RepID=Q9XX35_CAEEL|nr:F-box domain-containing protein [Caenorhabditis elegans]CAA21005.3 F-box domain-containing protein [Caenorhabditis elegans]|eukprot:NP_001256713.1 Uncharacterized protein CELE_Y32B12B.2 [Caenorhabditis elegans]